MTNPMVDALDPRRNSLNALRLALAALVVVSHAPLVAGLGDPYQWGDLEVGGWAVAGFFAISGWLITGSRLHLDLMPFLWRRCLRIFPAFWTALVVTALVAVPVSVLIGGGRLDWLSMLTYPLFNATLAITQSGIDGSLTTTPTSIWNLSLWTLLWEGLCYLGIGVVLCSKYVRRQRWPIAALFLLAAVLNAIVRIGDVSLPAWFEAAVRLGSFFLAGAMIRMYADSVPCRAWIAAICAVMTGLLASLDLVGAFGALPLAYLTLYAGVVLPLTRVGRNNDISYGVYIYAYPVAQLLVMAGVADLGIPLYVVATLIVVALPAWASWLLIERPAIQMKSLMPARGAA